MPVFTRTTNTPKSFEFEPLGRATLLDKIYIGFIKDTVDNQYMGRLKVWIPELGGDPADSSGWLTVSYASPFAGATNVFANTNGNQYLNSQRSYGMWFVPPDLENEILCCFINGDPGKGVWFACLYQQNMNHMVPGLPGNNTTNGLPVGEYNKMQTNINFNSPNRPTYDPLANALKTQGLDQDQIRGVSDSGARRANPYNSVYGLLTPGGSQFVLDDDPANTFIRLRTQGGVQILLNDDTGEIYMITSAGNNWFSMTADGAVSVYAANDITMRTERSFNIRADLDINFEAGRNMNIKARGDPDVEASSQGGGIIQMNANTAVHMSSGDDFFIGAQGDVHTFAQGGIFNTSKEDSNYKAAGSMFVQSDGGDVDIKAKAEIHATATNVHLNSVVPGDATAASFALAPQDLNVVDATVINGTITPITRRTILYNLVYHEPYPHDSSAASGQYNGSVQQTNPVTDPNIQLARKGEIVANSNVPLDIVGTPKPGMTPGYYKGIGYDNQGNPVYQYQGGATGPLTIGPCAGYSTSASGLAWLKSKEGMFWSISPDPPGQTKLFSIGHGHQLSPAELAGKYVIINGQRVDLPDGKITMAQADQLFQQDVVSKGENLVKKAITVSLTQSQFDSLVSFAYNTGHCSGTDLATAINAGNFEAVPQGFMNWAHPSVLISRRRQEAQWFMSGVKPPTG